jgi:hypothetical protein
LIRKLLPNLAEELRNSLANEVPNNKKYKELHSLLKSTSGKIIGSDLVDVAIQRTFQAYKRQRTSKVQESSGTAKLGRDATVGKRDEAKGEHETLGEDEPVELGNSPPILSGSSTGRYSHALATPTDFPEQLSTVSQRTQPWTFDLSTSEATTRTPEVASLRHPDLAAAPELTMSIVDDWLSYLHTPSSFTPAGEEKSVADQVETAKPPYLQHL